MKKVLLSIGVIIGFAIYSWHGRNEQGEVAVTAPVPTVTIKKEALYKNGIYTGSSADAVYGYIQVQAVVTDGRLTDVVFLEYPNDRTTSLQISRESMPYLKQEAIQTQSADVDVVSGATDTSEAFIESLEAALAKAKA